MKTRQTGFTLVEIAIVLVIIGLLLGGILKGQEMIVQAKVKNSISDFSGISAAYFGYQDRYRAIPGDDKDATRWGIPVAEAGDGDRVLAGTYASTVATEETNMWWDHLRRSGFVTGGNGIAHPNNSFNGLLGVQQGDNAGGTVLGGFSNLFLCSTNLPDKVAIALDVQMDDGNPGAGAVRAPDTGVSALATAASAYAETGNYTYGLCRQF
jgi:prepilin-type N-terminal cleavage/methylation domain-containing protein